MPDYNEMTPRAALEAALSYLYNIYNTDIRILGVRVVGWAKTGVLIGAWIYLKVIK